MTRMGTFIGAAFCAGLVSLTIASHAEAKETNSTKIRVDLGILASLRSPSAEPAFERHPQFTPLINRYARKNGLPLDLAHAVVRIESNFDPQARGRAGEIGLMQIKLATARLMGYRGSKTDLYDPETNIKYGMKYLGKAHELSGGTTCGTILRYNAGHGAKRMNKISSRYCSKVKKIIG
ncbi:MAG: lytic transglycosylase domain-containing protein [Pseudomonadota bacterium]